MRILVFNGSPKREGSDTMHLTRAFVSGMGEFEANEVQVLHTVDQDVRPCLGCFSCMKNGGDCVQKDGMAAILEQILDSDVLIWSFPLYCYGMPSTMKAIIDRTMPLSSMAIRRAGDRYEHLSQRDFSHLRYAMVSGCGFPGCDNNFEGMILQFRRMFNEDAAVVAVPESPLFNVPEAAQVTRPFLEIVRRAGRAFAERGHIPAEILEELSKPMIPPEEYLKICNGGK